MKPLNTNSVKKLVLKNTLKTHYSVAALIDLIVKQVKEIPDDLKVKQDIELLLMICTMIETICTDSEVSIDKLEAIRGVHSQVFDKAFVYKKGAFSTARKVLSWIAKVVVNLGINSASNNIA